MCVYIHICRYMCINLSGDFPSSNEILDPSSSPDPSSDPADVSSPQTEAFPSPTTEHVEPLATQNDRNECKSVIVCSVNFYQYSVHVYLHMYMYMQCAHGKHTCTQPQLPRESRTDSLKNMTNDYTIEMCRCTIARVFSM